MVELIPYSYSTDLGGWDYHLNPHVPALFLLANSIISIIHSYILCVWCMYIYIYIAGLFDTGVPSTSQFLIYLAITGRYTSHFQNTLFDNSLLLLINTHAP